MTHPVAPREENGPCLNTDRELWRGPDDGCGDFYADSIHVTKEGAIGMNCDGAVIVLPIREWHRRALSQADGETQIVGKIVDRLDKTRTDRGPSVSQSAELDK